LSVFVGVSKVVDRFPIPPVHHSFHLALVCQPARIVAVGCNGSIRGSATANVSAAASTTTAAAAGPAAAATADVQHRSSCSPQALPKRAHDPLDTHDTLTLWNSCHFDCPLRLTWTATANPGAAASAAAAPAAAGLPVCAAAAPAAASTSTTTVPIATP